MEPDKSCQETAAQFSLVTSLYNPGDLHDVMLPFYCTVSSYFMKNILEVRQKSVRSL